MNKYARNACVRCPGWQNQEGSSEKGLSHSQSGTPHSCSYNTIRLHVNSLTCTCTRHLSQRPKGAELVSRSPLADIMSFITDFHSEVKTLWGQSGKIWNQGDGEEDVDVFLIPSASLPSLGSFSYVCLFLLFIVSAHLMLNTQVMSHIFVP